MGTSESLKNRPAYFRFLFICGRIMKWHSQAVWQTSIPKVQVLVRSDPNSFHALPCSLHKISSPLCSATHIVCL
jgi:citrate synthase